MLSQNDVKFFFNYKNGNLYWKIKDAIIAVKNFRKQYHGEYCKNV